MCKTGKIMASMLIFMSINMFQSSARANVDSSNIFDCVQKYKARNSLFDTKNEDILLPEIDEKDIDDTPSVSTPRHEEKKDVYESMAVTISVICFALCIVKFLCGNFKIPFDYDPNFKSKHSNYKRAKSKKYKFQKR